MKIIAVIPVVLVALALHAHARADAGSVSLTIDPVTGLASGAGAPPPGTVGHWLTPATFTGRVVTVHNEIGWDESWGGASFSSSGLDPAATNGPPFGHYKAETTVTDKGYPMYASATLDASTLRVAWSRPDTRQDYAVGWLEVSRSFVLDPHASITLSGLAAFDHPLGAASVGSGEQEGRDWDLVEQAGIGMWAPDVFNNNVGFSMQVLNFDPTGPGNVSLGRTPDDSHFTYAHDSFGRLSMTLYNDSSDALFGRVWFSANAAAGLVPEPATWALLLAGLVFIVATPHQRGRARHASRSPIPAPGVRFS